MATGRIDTLETRADFPYTAMYDKDDIEYTTAPVIPTAKISPKLK